MSRKLPVAPATTQLVLLLPLLLLMLLSLLLLERCTAAQQNLCARKGTPALCCRVNGEGDCSLISHMSRTTPAGQSDNYEQMALDWCVKVDGIHFFSKLLVYLCNKISVYL